MINLDAIQAIAREPQRVADLEWWLALDKEDGRKYCPIARGYTCEEDGFDCIELCHSIWPTLREYDRIQGPCPCKSNIPQVKETFELIVRLSKLLPPEKPFVYLKGSVFRDSGDDEYIILAPLPGNKFVLIQWDGMYHYGEVMDAAEKFNGVYATDIPDSLEYVGHTENFTFEKE